MKEKNVIFIITIAYFLFEVVVGSQLFIWLDEAFTLNTTMFGSVEAIKRAVVFEGQPILYFLSLSIWREINDSIGFARLLSTILAALSIPAFYVYIKLKKQISNPVLLTFIYAFNPLVIWAGLEIRVYASMLLMGILLFYSFEKIYLSLKLPVKHRLLFILLAIISVHTHYYLSFILFINFIFLFFYKREIAFKYMLDMILPMLSLIPYAVYLSNQVSTHAVFKISSISDYVLYWYRHFRGFYFPIPKIFSSNIYNLALIGLLVMSIFLGIRKNIKSILLNIFKSEKYIITIIISMIVISNLLLFTIGQAGISTRHTLFLLVPTNILLYLILFKITNKSFQTIIMSLMILANFGNIYANAPNFGKETDLLRVSDIIKSQNSNNDPIICYTPEIQLVYSLIPHNSTVLSIPKPINLSVQYDHPSWFIKDTTDIIQFFEKESENQTLWLVDNAVNPLTESLLEKRFECNLHFNLLNTYVQKNFDVVMEKEIEGSYRVRKLSKKNK